MATLYQLTDDLQIIQNMIEEGAEGLEDTLESIELALEDKLEGYAMVIKNVESDVEGLKAEIKRLSERKTTLENGIKRMKENMQFALEISGNKSVKTPRFTIGLRKSTAVQIEDEEVIPEEFVKVTKTISRSELAERLKEQEVPGAKLVENQSLQIR